MRVEQHVLPVDCFFSQLGLKKHQKVSTCNLFSSVWVRFMRFDAPFNKTSAISWRLILLVEETGVPSENYRLVASHWKNVSHNVVSSTVCTSLWVVFEITTLVVICTHCTGSCRSNYHTIATAPIIQWT